MIIKCNFPKFPITDQNDLKEALKDVTYVQECTPERLEIKTAVFKDLDRILTEIGNDKAIIGSSTSTIMPAKFIGGFGISKRSVVVHPVRFNNTFYRFLSHLYDAFCKVKLCNEI